MSEMEIHVDTEDRSNLTVEGYLNGAKVGYVSLAPMKDSAAMNQDPPVPPNSYMVDISGVSVGLQRRGLGLKLYQAAIEEARKRGIDRVYAGISQSTEAQGVWKKLKDIYPTEWDKDWGTYIPLQAVKTAAGLKLNLKKNPQVAAVIAELDSKFPASPMNPNERVFYAQGEPAVLIEYAERDGRLRIKGIRSVTPKSGLGTLVLGRVLKVADLHGVTVELTASPTGDEKDRIGGDKLREWYTRFGFHPEQGHDEALGYMIREPQSKTASAKPDLSKIHFKVNDGGWWMSVHAYNGERQVGHLNLAVFKEGEEAPYSYVQDIVAYSGYEGIGLGQKMYDVAIEAAKKAGVVYFEQGKAQSEDGVKAWDRLAKRYPVVVDDKGKKAIKIASADEEWTPGPTASRFILRNFKGLPEKKRPRTGYPVFHRTANRLGWTMGLCFEWAIAYQELHGGDIYLIRGYYPDPYGGEGDENYEDAHAFISKDGGVTGTDAKGTRPVQEMVDQTMWNTNPYHTEIEKTSRDQLEREMEIMPEAIEEAKEDIKQHVKTAAGMALYIEVPKGARDHFWEEPPEHNWEFWAFKSRPYALPGEQIIFTFNKKPVATATVHHVEPPGKTKCELTGKFEKHWKVYWEPKTFIRYKTAGLDDTGDPQIDLEPFTEGDDKQQRYRLKMHWHSRPIGEMVVIVKPDHLKIHDVNVVPEYRGKGMGKRLYLAAIHLAQKLGLPEIQSDYNITEDAAKVWKNLKAEPFNEPGGSTRYRYKVAANASPVYHGTAVENLPAIQQEGLKGQPDNPAYATTKKPEALWYALDNLYARHPEVATDKEALANAELGLVTIAPGVMPDSPYDIFTLPDTVPPDKLTTGTVRVGDVCEITEDPSMGLIAKPYGFSK